MWGIRSLCVFLNEVNLVKSDSGSQIWIRVLTQICRLICILKYLIFFRLAMWWSGVLVCKNFWTLEILREKVNKDTGSCLTIVLYAVEISFVFNIFWFYSFLIIFASSDGIFPLQDFRSSKMIMTVAIKSTHYQYYLHLKLVNRIKCKLFTIVSRTPVTQFWLGFSSLSFMNILQIMYDLSVLLVHKRLEVFVTTFYNYFLLIVNYQKIGITRRFSSISFSILLCQVHFSFKVRGEGMLFNFP